MANLERIRFGELTPGFFELNLRILSGADNEQLLYMLGEQEVELKQCPDCMKPVIRNIMAILTYAHPQLRGGAIAMMTQIHEQYPDNLNTLGNMICMLKNNKQNTLGLEAKLNKALKNKREQAKCWVEKGYVLVMDLHSEVRESTSKKMKDTSSRLNERREAGEFTARYQQEACREAQKLLQIFEKKVLCIPESCTEETKQERIQSVLHFQRGIQEMKECSCPEEEIAIWQHHLGKSCNRVGSSSPDIRVREKKEYLKQAVDAFVKSICGIPQTSPENSIYIARSYAYLSHLIITKDRIVKGEKEEVPRSLAEVNIPIWEQPLQGFETALQICPNDRVVLNRYGLALNKIKGDEIKKVDALEKAVHILEESIKIESNYNWFAYSVLSQTHIHRYKLLVKANSKRKSHQLPDKGLLDTALQYGDRCLYSRTTLECLLTMAEAHYLIGINPEKVKSLKDRVIDPYSINKALEFLQRGLEHHQCYSHPRLYSMLGKCLFDSGAHLEGIKYMKLAIRVEKENIKDPNNFGELVYFLLFHHKELKMNKDKRLGKAIEEKRRLQHEIWCILKESKRKYKDRMKYHLIGNINKYPHDIMDVLEEIFDYKTDRNTEDLASECKQILDKHNSKVVRTRATEVWRGRHESTGKPPENIEFVVRGPKTSLLSDEKKYDFYVCHTSHDEDWVKLYLMQDLENPLQGKNGFKGCLRGRDVELDAPPSQFMDQCHKFLFIISKGWEDDKRFQADLSYAKATNPMTKRLIPILRDDIDLPKILQDVVGVDYDDILKIRQTLAGDVENASIEGRNVEDDFEYTHKGLDNATTSHDIYNTARSDMGSIATDQEACFDTKKNT